MKTAGHTMGTPEYTLEEAIDLFNALGLDGIEIVVQDGFKCGLGQEVDEARIQSIRRKVHESGMEVSCLTPYNTNFNSLDEDERQKDIKGIEKVIQMAALCDASFIRIYGGAFGDDDITHEADMEKKLIDSMRALGDVAKAHDVTLVIENHFHTMTTTAEKSVNIVKKIAHPHVGILYDQANLAILKAEEYEVAIAMQAEYIRYVHVKDMVYKEGDRKYTSSQVSHIKEDDRITASRILGEGILPWEKIIRELIKINYDGWLSHEYERRWAPKDLPDANIGMRKSVHCLKNILNDQVK